MQAICLPEGDRFSDGAFPSAGATCFLNFPIKIFLSPLANLEIKILELQYWVFLL